MTTEPEEHRAIAAFPSLLRRVARGKSSGRKPVSAGEICYWLIGWVKP